MGNYIVSYMELHLKTFTLNHLQKNQSPPPPPFSLYVLHFSSVTFFPSFFPLSLVSITPFPPSDILIHFSFICIFCSFASSLPSWPWSRSPDLLALGYQMVCLAEGFELTLTAADPILPQTPGGLGVNRLLKQVER